MRVQCLDHRLLHPAQLDDGAVRRAGPGGGLRDAAVPGARSPGAHRPRRARRRRHPAVRAVVVGHRRDGRQLDHRRRAVRARRRASTRRWRCCRSATSTSRTYGTPTACAPPAPTTSSSPTPSFPLTGWCGCPTSTRAPRPAPALHDADTYRWPMVPALALLAAMPALGSAERVADIYAERLSKRVLAYEGVTQKDKPIAQAHLGRGAGAAAGAARAARRHRRAARNHRRRRRSRAPAGARRGAAGGGAHRARVAGA